MVQDINTIARFLAKRDIESLTQDVLRETYDIEQAQAMFVFGNDLPYVMEFASEMYQRGLAKDMVLCGGIGHSTENLRKAVVSSDRYPYSYEDVKNLSEAEIYGRMATDIFGIPKEHLFLDATSTNCGENAVNGLKIFRQMERTGNHLILVQDPMLQMRSRASLEMHREDEVIISYAPFITEVTENQTYTAGIADLWKFERFIELLMGEIPRLKDDANGYGPRGKNFIPHVEIPPEVLEAYERLDEAYGSMNMRKLRQE